MHPGWALAWLDHSGDHSTLGLHNCKKTGTCYGGEICALTAALRNDLSKPKCIGEIEGPFETKDNSYFSLVNNPKGSLPKASQNLIRRFERAVLLISTLEFFYCKTVKSALIPCWESLIDPISTAVSFVSVSKGVLCPAEASSIYGSVSATL